MAYCQKHHLNQPDEKEADEICLRCRYDTKTIDEQKVCCFCGMEGHLSKDCPVAEEMKR